MEIIYRKNNVDVEASGEKSKLLIGLLLLFGGIYSVPSISRKLNIKEERLESLYNDPNIKKTINHMNNIDWVDQDPEKLNFGIFKGMSSDQIVKLQNEWKEEFKNRSSGIKQPVENKKNEENKEAQENENLKANILARTLFHEARGDGESGMRDVASVIYNRSQRSGRSMVNECLRKSQFCVWTGSSDESKSKIVDESKRYTAPADRRAWDIALKIAQEMVAGSFTPTINADHFHTPNVSPSWSRNIPGQKRGSHLFYNLGYR